MLQDDDCSVAGDRACSGGRRFEIVSEDMRDFTLEDSKGEDAVGR